MLSLNVRSGLVLLVAAVMLPGCSVNLSTFGIGGGGAGTSLTEEDKTGATGAVNFSATRSNPFDAYIVMGGLIKRCWFNATDPLLPDHVYRADVSPGGGKVKITVHQRARLGRAGLIAYVIDFEQSGPSTVITSENRKMPSDLAAKMQYDINRWQRGQVDCDKTMPKA